MSKAPSPAQLAARAKFAAAAKAGKFKRSAAAGKAKARKRNPVAAKQGDAPEYFARVKGRGWVREYQRNAPVHMWRYAKDFADAQVWGEGQAVQIKTMCDACSATCELVSVADNPLTRVRVKSPSMATGAAPSKRLTKRRKATNKAPAGYYANPAKVTAVAALPTYYPVGRVAVHVASRGKPGQLLAEFPKKADAVAYANAWAKAHDRAVIVVGRE